MCTVAGPCNGVCVFMCSSLQYDTLMSLSFLGLLFTVVWSSQVWYYVSLCLCVCLHIFLQLSC